MNHKLQVLFRLAYWPMLALAIVGLGALIVLMTAATKQRATRDCCRDAGILIVGVEAGLGAETLEVAQKRLLAAAEAAGYYCEPSPKGVWSCR